MVYQENFFFGLLLFSNLLILALVVNLRVAYFFVGFSVVAFAVVVAVASADWFDVVVSFISFVLFSWFFRLSLVIVLYYVELFFYFCFLHFFIWCLMAVGGDSRS